MLIAPLFREISQVPHRLFFSFLGTRLPDGIIQYQKYQSWYILRGNGMEKIEMVQWYIFGLFCCLQIVCQFLL
jgi:hypothetical protein